MIFAPAGRRVDATDAKSPRFPAANIDLVKQRLRALFEKERPQALVCSAAAGADLLALEVTGELGIRREVVLPFSAEIFRKASVDDRPGDWGPRFDRIIEELKPHGKTNEKTNGHVSCLNLRAHDESAYLAANEAILKRARELGSELQRETPKHQPHPVWALLVWNGDSRGNGDVTEAFQKAATASGMKLLEISTMK